MTYGEMLDQDSISRVREGKRTVASVTASNVIGKRLEGEDREVPALVPLDPRAAHAKGFDMVLKSFLDDPQKFALLANTLRVRYPDLAGFSDSQLVRIATAMYDQAVRDATNEAFVNTGREHELQIKTEGF